MWPWKTDEELFDFQLENVNVTGSSSKDNILLRPPRGLEKFKDPKFGIGTPTRRFEIYCSVFEQAGANPIPEYQEFHVTL